MSPRMFEPEKDVTTSCTRSRLDASLHFAANIAVFSPRSRFHVADHSARTLVSVEAFSLSISPLMLVINSNLPPWFLHKGHHGAATASGIDRSSFVSSMRHADLEFKGERVAVCLKGHNR